MKMLHKNISLDDFDGNFSSETILLKVGTIISGILIEFIGNALCLGIICYERNGGDPQKRTILNSLQASLALTMFVYNIFPLNVFLIRILVGPMNFWYAKILFFIPRAAIGLSALLCMIEMIVIRYFSIFVWKRLAPLDDSFFHIYLMGINGFLGTVIAIQVNFGNNIEKDLEFFLTGTLDRRQMPTFRFYSQLLFTTVGIHILAGCRIGLKKFQHWRKERKTRNRVGAQPSIYVVPESNRSRNPTPSPANLSSSPIFFVRNPPIHRSPPEEVGESIEMDYLGLNDRDPDITSLGSLTWSVEVTSIHSEDLKIKDRDQRSLKENRPKSARSAPKSGRQSHRMRSLRNLRKRDRDRDLGPSDQDDLTDIQLSNHELYNNQASNIEIFTIVANGAVILCLLGAFIRFFVISSDLSIEKIIFSFLGPQFFLAVVAPMTVYLSHPEISKFVKEKALKCCCLLEDPR